MVTTVLNAIRQQLLVMDTVIVHHFIIIGMKHQVDVKDVDNFVDTVFMIMVVVVGVSLINWLENMRTVFVNRLSIIMIKQ